MEKVSTSQIKTDVINMSKITTENGKTDINDDNCDIFVDYFCRLLFRKKCFLGLLSARVQLVSRLPEAKIDSAVITK